MSLDEKLLAKIQKIQALAERGVGGEKDNAARMLAKLLQKHGLTLDDLGEEKRTVRWFPARDLMERRLACQILAKVCATQKISAYTSKKRRKHIGVEVTPAEAIEFEIHYLTLRRALKEHLQTSFSAFIQANRLFGPSSDDDTPAPITEDDIRVMEMAATIKPTAVAMRLPSHPKTEGRQP